MSEFNQIEMPIIPESPKLVPNEVLHVYIPKATYKIPGVASFSDDYFVLDKAGCVKLTDWIIKVINESASQDWVSNKLVDKLDRDVSVTDLVKAYVKTPNGSQNTLDISEGVVVNSIMYRDSYGRSCVVMPGDNPQHIANKEYVDNVAGGKVDKINDTNDTVQLYAALNDNSQGSIRATYYSIAGTAVFRDNWGRAEIETPEYPRHIANKQYVDTEIAKFDFIKVVPSLDAVTNPLPNKIYFVPKADDQNQDLFDEWVWINKGTEAEPYFDWEWITTKQLEVDLTPYATIIYVDELNAQMKGYVDTYVDIDELILDAMLEEVFV